MKGIKEIQKSVLRKGKAVLLLRRNRVMEKGQWVVGPEESHRGSLVSEI